MTIKEGIDKIRALLATQPDPTETAEVPAEETPTETTEEVATVEVEAADMPSAPAAAPEAPEVEPENGAITELQTRIQSLETTLNQIVQRLNGMQGVMMSDLTPLRESISTMTNIVEKLSEIPSEEPTPIHDYSLPKKKDRLAEIADNIKAAKEQLKK